MKDKFKALILDKKQEDISIEIKDLTENDLPVGEVLIKVAYSSVNYKDALATIPNGNIVKKYPFVPGIDLSGTVVKSDSDRFKEGDQVIATSYDIGVSHFGGYSEYARIPAEWMVPLPEILTLKEAMIIGTAGFTAALSVDRLLAVQDLHQGKVLVTGATGGVGSFATAILSKLGVHVEASTGKQAEIEYLTELGASSIISREEVFDGKVRALDKQKWIAAVDSVGGQALASVLSQIQYGGAVAASGLTAGAKLPTTVFPFILRGVNLLGIDSVFCPMEKRERIWQRLASDFKPAKLENFIQEEVTLEELPNTFQTLLEGKARGRTIVKM